MPKLYPTARTLNHWTATAWQSLAILIAAWAVAYPVRAEDGASTATSSSATNTSSAASAQSTAEHGAAANQSGADQISTDKNSIDAAIARLGSADYLTREEAVRQLVAVGRPAIGSLAKAAHAVDLETSYRAVRVLQSLLDQDSETTQQEAAAELQKLAADPASPVADLATDGLAFYHLSLQDKAVEALQKLGATVASDLMNMDPGDLQITLDDHWKGKSSDLNLLKQIRNLSWLRIINRPLNEKELSTIGELSQATEIDLFGTGTSADAAKQLATALPNAVIDRRNGAFLGVGGMPGTNSCQITEVRPESAAEAAGIVVGDEIVSFDGQPVHNFEEFTTQVSNKKGGDQIEVLVKRGDQTLTKKVTLGHWQADQQVTFHGNPRVRSAPTPVQMPTPAPAAPAPAIPVTPQAK